ncbi:peptidoglycan-binding protein [Yoonia sp. R2331]|uniref:peptidoglycan-binding domain-containing protein n=1 Tax=Yoonia sp. R2331 TaxID=3237238 RepID=UPI0034E4810D
MNVKRIVILAGLAVAGCAPAPATGPETPVSGSLVIDLGEIETRADGRCFARAAGQTETQIVTELVEVQPAVKDRNGVVITPAIFRNITGPRTVEVGQGAQFETVCPQVYTRDFVATLQRALIVRRAYDGAVTGLMDSDTSAALQAFQKAMGVDSPLLAVAVARDLGIVAVPRG